MFLSSVFKANLLWNAILIAFDRKFDAVKGYLRNRFPMVSTWASSFKFSTVY